MADIALVSFYKNDISIQVLSLYLKKHGHNVFSFFWPGEVNSFNTAKIISFVRENNISLVGLSVFTDTSCFAAKLTKAIKEECPAILVVWGGVHASIMPMECLMYADIVCIGEGEEALLELAVSVSSGGVLEKNIKNMWFRKSDGIIKNELRQLEDNLDRYDYHNFDLSNQFLVDKKGFNRWDTKYLETNYSIITSRGCLYSCSYCYNNSRRKLYAGKGNYLRFRSIDNVIAELIKVKSAYRNLKKINFCDDIFILREVKEIERFKELYLKEIGIPFQALVDPRSFNKNKFCLLVCSGLRYLQVGIQTGSESCSDKVYNRKVRNSQLIEMANIFKINKIVVIYDIIFNNPYETIDDIKETIRLLLKLPQPFWLEGYNLLFSPGTDITEAALRDGYISTNNECNDFTSVYKSENSPFSSFTKCKLSTRFYNIKFDSHEKAYWNTVIFLFTLYNIPFWFRRRLIESLLKFDSIFKQRLILPLAIALSIFNRIIAKLKFIFGRAHY